MQTKLCKAIKTVVRVTPKAGDPFDMAEFFPSNPEMIAGIPATIHPDANGEMWYWTPEPEIPVDAE